MAHCVNDLQLLSGNNMFTEGGPSNILQLTGGLSFSVEYSFGSKQSTIPDFALTGRNSLLSNKESGFVRLFFKLKKPFEITFTRLTGYEYPLKKSNIIFCST